MLGVPRSQEEARQQGCSESARESTNKRLLNEDMKERPAATIAQRIRFLESVRECHGEASELLERLASVEAPGMEPKKRAVGAASKRDEWLRAAWRVMVSAPQVDPERLVFVVDEMGTNTSLSPVYAWAPKGRRAYCSGFRATAGRTRHYSLA